MSKVYLMCGCPGQGKSTWAKDNLVYGDVYVSRDAIRFYLLNDDEDYFSREKEVIKVFKYNIEEALKRGDNVWVDATFLTRKSRAWVVNLASQYGAKIMAVAFKHSLETCLEWNKQREGRSFVPESAIRRMYEQFEEPEYDEGFNEILLIGG